MLPRVNVPAEDKARLFLHNSLGQLRRSEMLGIRLERTVDIAAVNARRRMRNENVYPLRNLREPFGQRVVFTLERPRVRYNWNPRRPVELHTANLRAPVAKEMDIWRKAKAPIYARVLEKNMGDAMG